MRGRRLPSERRPSAGNYTLVVGPAQGKFAGQPPERRYEIRLHGLLKPSSVAVNDARLPEIEPGQCGSGLDVGPTAERRRFACRRQSPAARNSPSASRAPERSPTQWPSKKVLNLRQQVRQAKRLMKLKTRCPAAG